MAFCTYVHDYHSNHTIKSSADGVWTHYITPALRHRLRPSWLSEGLVGRPKTSFYLTSLPTYIPTVHTRDICVPSAFVLPFRRQRRHRVIELSRAALATWLACLLASIHGGVKCLWV